MSDLFADPPKAHARRDDPETSHEAAEAITPGLGDLQGRVEAYAIEKGPAGFTDAALSEELADPGSTYRTRRAELTDRNIILDSGRRAKHGESERNRIVWVHRNFVANPPEVREASTKATNEDREEARTYVPLIRSWAKQMRGEGRGPLANALEDVARLLAKLAQ